MPAPDPERAILPDDGVAARSEPVEASPLAATPAPDLSTPAADDLEVLADDEGDPLSDEELQSLDPSLGTDLEVVAMPEVVLTPPAPAPAVAATPETLDTSLDGRAVEMEEVEGETELELDTSPATPVATPQADDPLAPAGETVVELADEDIPLAVELEAMPTVEPAVVNASELELVEEEVITGEPVVELESGQAETVPELIDADDAEAEAAKDALFDRHNQDLSAGLDEDS
jgi:hypothetical protein